LQLVTQFEKGRQEDAHELILKLLDRMHAESKITDDEEREFRKPEKVSVKQLWDNHISRHGSLTSKIFEGLQSVQILCMGCKANQIKHEIFSVMSLGLVKNESKLQNILIQNFQTEKFIGDNKLHCEKCNKKCDATKTSRVIHLPHVLVVTLKRFEYDPKINDFVKIEKAVQYDEVDFTLPMQVSRVSVNMELFAVIVVAPHQCQTGRISSGHYYAIIKDEHADWIVCNDERTRKVNSPVPAADQIDKNAYILFYRKTDKPVNSKDRQYMLPLKDSHVLDEDDSQVPEGQVLVASKELMNDLQYQKATEIMRAPTTKIPKSKLEPSDSEAEDKESLEADKRQLQHRGTGSTLESNQNGKK